VLDVQGTEEQTGRCILLLVVIVGDRQWSCNGEWRLDVHCVQLAALQLSIKVSLLHLRSSKRRSTTDIHCRGQ
jgi:hypothetical protein